MSHSDRPSVHLSALCLHWAAEQHQAGCTSGMQPPRSLPSSSSSCSSFSFFFFPSFMLLFPHCMDSLLAPSPHFPSVPPYVISPLLPLIILPSALPLLLPPFSPLLLPILSPFSPPLPFSLAFFYPLFKIQGALSKLTPPPSSSPHLPSLCPPSLIPLLSNPNKPGRTFLCGGRRRNTPHVRRSLNINISQFEVLEKDVRRLSSTRDRATIMKA